MLVQELFYQGFNNELINFNNELINEFDLKKSFSFFFITNNKVI